MDETQMKQNHRIIKSKLCITHVCFKFKLYTKYNFALLEYVHFLVSVYLTFVFVDKYVLCVDG